MAVSMTLLQSVTFIKPASPFGFSCNSQLPTFPKFSCVRPLKAAATSEEKYEEPAAPVLEMDTAKLDLPSEEKPKKAKKSIYRTKNKKIKNRDLTRSTRVNVDSLGILKYQLITQAAMKLLETENTLVFVVDTKADKIMIREAVEKMCGVRVKDVNTLIRPDMKKKAFVKLIQDQDALDIGKQIGII